MKLFHPLWTMWQKKIEEDRKYVEMRDAELSDAIRNWPHHCHDCEQPIYIKDNEAGVCIECGGMNRRWKR